GIGNDEMAAENLARAASVATVDRRAHVRISYPLLDSLGSLPQITYNGREVRPANISLGGMLLKGKGLGVKQACEYEFVFKWSDRPDGVGRRAVLLRLGGSNHHFKFLELATERIVRCS